MVYANFLILLGEYMDMIKTPETLPVATKEVGVGINRKEIKHMFVSRRQNVGQSHDIETARKR
jgi:hypothetical protein